MSNAGFGNGIGLYAGAVLAKKKQSDSCNESDCFLLYMRNAGSTDLEKQGVFEPGEEWKR